MKNTDRREFLQLLGMGAMASGTLTATIAKALEIPANAVVVPGARQAKGKWAQDQGISLQTPVIVKYRDEKTDAATALESWLR